MAGPMEGGTNGDQPGHQERPMAASSAEHGEGPMAASSAECEEEPVGLEEWLKVERRPRPLSVFELQSSLMKMRLPKIG